MPVLVFGFDLLFELFVHTEFPVKFTQSWTLYDLQNIIKTAIVIVEANSLGDVASSVVVLTTARYVLWIVPCALGGSIILQLLDLKGPGKFIGFWALLLNLVIVGSVIFGFPRFVETVTNLEQEVLREMYFIPVTTYIYFGLANVALFALLSTNNANE